jgi:regulator of sigma E protease
MLNAAQDLLIHLSAFIFVLGLVVFVHEFGHFQVARWCGVAIEAFSIGFGRRLAAWTDKSGVLWKIGMLPLGGYVKFVDDGEPTSTLAREAPADPAEREALRKRGLFHAQPIWVRALVAAAGPISNFIFATIAFAAILMAFGRDVTDVRTLAPRIDQVQIDSPAAAAGMQAGDVVVSIDGMRIDDFGALQSTVSTHAGKAMSVVVRRGEQTLTLSATPVARKVTDQEGVDSNVGVLGIGRSTSPEERKTERLGPIAALGAGAEQVGTIVASTAGYVTNIFTGRASAEHIAGPLGILDMSGQVAKMAGQGPTLADQLENLFGGLIGWAATLSVAVGIVNLLPIPILDGGHLLFYAIEAVRGRPLDQKAQMIGFRAGMALLGSLFLFATWNDLQRLNLLEFLRGMLS